MPLCAVGLQYCQEIKEASRNIIVFSWWIFVLLFDFTLIRTQILSIAARCRTPRRAKKIVSNKQSLRGAPATKQSHNSFE
jgi:hypothetical protein